MNIKMMNEIKSQGHPCSGCPYVLLGVAQTASWVLFRGTVHGIFTSG